MVGSKSTGPRHARSNVDEDDRPVVTTQPRDRDARDSRLRNQALREREVHDRDRRDGDTRTMTRDRDLPVVEEHRVMPAKTSIAAVLALVLGLTSVYMLLTVLLAPVAIVLSIVGVILGVLGYRAARTMGVTGKGVAITGLILSILALAGGIVLVAGVTTYLNDEDAVQRLENWVQDIRDDLPQNVEIQP